MPPSLEEMREEADELAEVRVSALLQAFAMPQITQEQIRELLVHAISTSYTGGFAAGWDSALDEAANAVATVDRFQPTQRPQRPQVDIIERLASQARTIEPEIKVDSRAWVPMPGGTVTTLSDWIRKMGGKK